MVRKTPKKTINLYDFYWQVELAAQRLVLIRRALGLKSDGKIAEFDWIMEAFGGENVEVDENGEFEMATGYVMTRGWKDSETKEQKVDFFFSLSSN